MKKKKEKKRKGSEITSTNHTIQCTSWNNLLRAHFDFRRGRKKGGSWVGPQVVVPLLLATTQARDFDRVAAPQIARAKGRMRTGGVDR